MNLYLPLSFHSLGLPVCITHIQKMCVHVYVYVNFSFHPHVDFLDMESYRLAFRQRLIFIQQGEFSSNEHIQFSEKKNWIGEQATQVLYLTAVDQMSDHKDLYFIPPCKIDMLCKLSGDFWMKNAIENKNSLHI